MYKLKSSYYPLTESIPGTNNMGYCPYAEVNSSPSGTYQTLDNGSIPPEKRASNANQAIPESAPNGGLYTGPQSYNPWSSIPVIPSDTNLIHYNLRSANPPPGATEQYVGTDRLGNNYAPMIGVYWYNPEDSKGMYRISVTKKEDAKQY
jgi:hypothetical protein